jgi:hypothetical protein
MNKRNKMKGRKIKQVLLEVGNNESVEDIGKGCKRVNMVKILCTQA